VRLPGIDYYEKTGTKNTVSGTDLYDIPTDCFELKYLTYTTAGAELKLKRFNLDDYPIDTTGMMWELNYTPLWIPVGNQFKIIPTPTKVYTLKLYYIPYLPGIYEHGTNTPIAALADVADYLDDKWGFSDYIILDVAAKIVEEQQEDSRPLRQQQAVRWEEIEGILAARGQDTPKRLPEPKHHSGGMDSRYYTRYR
jgi:hypothetical protein